MLAKGEPPEGKSPNPIDRFILERLKRAGLEPAPRADRETLLRRLTFNLTGLPPTPKETEAFLADRSRDSYRKVVRRNLDSPAYGERWAQHWLDLVGFAESDGFEHDYARKEAWRYRDWVIRALNGNMPYDRFVRLQIAGDEIQPGDANALIATNFLMAGPDMEDINLQEERRHTKLNGMTSSVGQVFLGLTFECAQCHDHKYDPVSQADFYRLRAIFANTVWPKYKKQLSTVVREPGPKVPEEHLMIRGDFLKPGPAMEPGVPRVVDPRRTALTIEATSKSSGRRKAFAAWLTRPERALFARVITNWLWTQHFGRGIVSTPENFGRKGEDPTHPELLDWLAAELPRRGWSLKAMHELIVTSETWRRASRSGGDRVEWIRASKADPENRLFWRANRRRLGGEAIRDSMLAVSGRLNRKRGGPGVNLPLPREISVTLKSGKWTVTKNRDEHRRRSIYLFAKRNLRYPLFEAFDRPSADGPCAQRRRSTTPTQSLMLINSAFSLEMARSLAGKLMSAVGSDRARLVESAYQWTLGRSPSDREGKVGVAFLERQVAALRKAGRSESSLAFPERRPKGTDAIEGAALTDFCLALYNVNEFIYVD